MFNIVTRIQNKGSSIEGGIVGLRIVFIKNTIPFVDPRAKILASVERTVTALVQLLTTVADCKSCGWAGCAVIPASPFQGLRSVRKIVTLINTSTVTIMPASASTFQ
jgi:hypothetical protein